jgi:hypothetical protein
VERRRIIATGVAVLLASLAGALAGYAAMRVAGLLLPGGLGGGRLAAITVIGYVTWAAVALAVSAAWLRSRARSR